MPAVYCHDIFRLERSQCSRGMRPPLADILMLNWSWREKRDASEVTSLRDRADTHPGNLAPGYMYVLIPRVYRTDKGAREASSV